MSRYLDEFVRCRCAPDMLTRKLFPNAKEITESFGAYNAAREHLHVSFGDASIAVLCVGDGHVPRTAATFAFRSAWTCLSVDPLMRDGWTSNTHGVARLHAYRAKVDLVAGWKVPGDFSRAFDRAIVVAVHSHASLRASIETARQLAPRVSAISIPCCFKDDVGAALVVNDDYGILSPHRRVFVWRDA